MHSWIVTAIGIGLAGSALAADRTLVKQVESGNAKYAAGEFDEALEVYKLAEADCPECPELAYNQGLAHYRMRDFEKAHEKFNEALLTRDLRLEQRAKYNLGNVAYAQALEKMADPKEAVEHAQRAIAFYRDALELDENDTQARANIEIAQLLIKQLLDEQKQQQEQEPNQQEDQQQQSEQNEQCDNPQQGQSDEQPENQQDQQEQQQEGSQDQESDEQQQQQQQQEGQEGQPEQQEQQSGDAEPGDQQQAQAQQYEQRELTREEAERLLQAVRDKEAQRRDEKARQMRAKRVPVKRDW